MGEVKRYAGDAVKIGETVFHVRESDSGCFVLHSDYAALEAERDALRAEVAKLSAACAMKETALIVYRTTVEDALNDKNLGHDIWLLLQGISGAITTRTSKWYNAALSDDAGKNYVDASGAVEAKAVWGYLDDENGYSKAAVAAFSPLPDDWAGRTVLVMVKP